MDLYQLIKYIKSNFQIIIFQKDLVESHAQQIVYLLTRFTAPLAVRGGKNSREYQGSPDWILRFMRSVRLRYSPYSDSCTGEYGASLCWEILLQVLPFSNSGMVSSHCVEYKRKKKLYDKCKLTVIQINKISKDIYLN